QLLQRIADRLNWGTDGTGSHQLVVRLEKPLVLSEPGQLVVSLTYPSGENSQDNGRFRLSVSSDPAKFDREQKRFAAMKRTDPWLKLAAASAASGRDDLLSAVGKQHADKPQLQLALARIRAERGKQHLAEKQPVQAQDELEKSRAILTRLRAESKWTVLTPIELRSQGGETLTVEKDGSIFVSGPNPTRAVYTLKFRTDLPTVT